MWIWDTPPEQAMADIYDSYTRRVYRELLSLAKKFAPQVEAWMKANAVWTDRTGNARQGLYAEVEKSLFEIAIVIDYSVEYGYWLEYAHQGNYAIIGPALDVWSVQFWNAVQDLMNS